MRTTDQVDDEGISVDDLTDIVLGHSGGVEYPISAMPVPSPVFKGSPVVRVLAFLIANGTQDYERELVNRFASCGRLTKSDFISLSMAIARRHIEDADHSFGYINKCIAELAGYFNFEVPESLPKNIVLLALKYPRFRQLNSLFAPELAADLINGGRIRFDKWWNVVFMDLRHITSVTDIQAICNFAFLQELHLSSLIITSFSPDPAVQELSWDARAFSRLVALKKLEIDNAQLSPQAYADFMSALGRLPHLTKPVIRNLFIVDSPIKVKEDHDLTAMP